MQLSLVWFNFLKKLNFHMIQMCFSRKQNSKAPNKVLFNFGRRCFYSASIQFSVFCFGFRLELEWDNSESLLDFNRCFVRGDLRYLFVVFFEWLRCFHHLIFLCLIQQSFILLV
jgi:hypothetical protein